MSYKIFIKDHISFLITFTIIQFFNFSCGKNNFADMEDTIITEQASKYLESAEPQKAIDILLTSLGDEFKSIYTSMDTKESSEISSLMASEISTIVNAGNSDVYSMVSILASAHAQLYGIDPLDLSLQLAKSESTDSTESSNTSTALYKVLPEGTEANKKGISHALAILGSIDSANLTEADNFKMSIFFMANISLITKALDKKLDGEISAEEALSLIADDADELFNLMDLALIAATESGEIEDSSTAAKATSTISQARTKLNDSEGSDNIEKARNYIIAN